METKYLRLTQVAQELGCCVDTVRKLVKQRVLPSVQYTPKSPYLVHVDDVQAYREAHTTTAKVKKAALKINRTKVPDIIPRSEWGNG